MRKFVIIFISMIFVASSARSEDIKLSNSRSSPAIPFQVLPNIQKFGVYDSTACAGCDSDAPTLFSAGEFKEGQADQLIRVIERTTGFKVPDGIDAAARLNGLIKDRNFGKKLLEIKENNELGSSWEFSAGEFKGPMTPKNLINAIERSGIAIPVIETPVRSLNKLIEDKDLYKVMTGQYVNVKDCMGRMQQGHQLSPLEIKDFNRCLVEVNVIRESLGRLQQGQQLSLLETKVLNRFLIEANYPLETPPIQDAVALVISMKRLEARSYLSPEEVRFLLEANYPKETPKTFFENYQRVQDQLPISVQNTVYVTNDHLFPKDGTHLHFTFSTDDRMYYGVPVLPGFDLMELDADTNKTVKIAHFYVGDHIVPNLRINTISVSPDNKKVAIDMTSDPITLFGDSYHDMVVLNLSGPKTKVYDLGNKVSYGGWWSPASDMFYTSCPLLEHSAAHNNEVCGINLNFDR